MLTLARTAGTDRLDSLHEAAGGGRGSEGSPGPSFFWYDPAMDAAQVLDTSAAADDARLRTSMNSWVDRRDTSAYCPLGARSVERP